MFTIMRGHQVGHRQVAVAPRREVSRPPLDKGREQQPQHRRKPLLYARRDHLAHAGLRLDLLHPLVERGQRHHDLRPDQVQRADHLVLGVDGVERTGDRPDLPERELGDEELRAVGQHEGHPVAACHTELRQRYREGIGGSVELGAGDRGALEQEHRAVGPFAHRVGGKVEQRALRVRHESAGYTLVVLGEPRIVGHSARKVVAR